MEKKIRRQNLSSEERKKEFKAITDLILEDNEFEVTRCPHCGSEHIIKKGRIRGGHRKYLCKDCKKNFSETYGTIFYRKKLCQAQIKALIVGANDESCRRIARKLNINHKTVFAYRHKLLDKMLENPEQSNLTDKISLDETFYGTFECRMKNNGVRDLRQSSEKIVIGADTNHNIFAMHIGDNHTSLNDVIQELSYMLANGEDIVHDASTGIEKTLGKCGFGYENIEIIKAMYKKDSIELRPVNHACSSLKYYLNKHKAIKSRWIRSYINYYNYDYKSKIINVADRMKHLLGLFDIKNGKIGTGTL